MTLSTSRCKQHSYVFTCHSRRKRTTQQNRKHFGGAITKRQTWEHSPSAVLHPGADDFSTQKCEAFSLLTPQELYFIICLISYTCSVTQLWPILCDPMDYSSPGSSVHEIFQARILKWVAISFSRNITYIKGRLKKKRNTVRSGTSKLLPPIHQLLGLRRAWEHFSGHQIGK